MVAKSRKSKSSKMLFIGNSFTARNNLPGLITELARAQGVTIEHRLISAGGASLRRHWNAGVAPEAIRNGGFDFVVLQEQSTLPVKNAERMHESVRLFDQVIREAGSNTVLYMTWARRNLPDQQQAITDAYDSIGRELSAIVVPVGPIWQRFLDNHDDPVLHDRDLSHPSLAGSFLAACVFVATLYGLKPKGDALEVTGLDADVQAVLRAVASESISRKPRS